MIEPTTIKRDRFRSSLATIINNSGLSALNMIDILEDMLGAVKELHMKQERDERALWEEELRKEKSKNPGVEKSESHNGG